MSLSFVSSSFLPQPIQNFHKNLSFLLIYTRTIILTYIKTKQLSFAIGTYCTLPKSHKKEHIVILGYGRLGKEICAHLEFQGINYIAIDNNIQNVISAQKEGRNVIFGNAAKKQF